MRFSLDPIDFKNVLLFRPHLYAQLVFYNNNNLFQRNRSGTALGHSGLFSAALFLIIPHISDCSFGDDGHFFASETFTWYHHCSQHCSGYGQPEAMVK